MDMDVEASCAGAAGAPSATSAASTASIPEAAAAPRAKRAPAKRVSIIVPAEAVQRKPQKKKAASHRGASSPVQPKQPALPDFLPPFGAAGGEELTLPLSWVWRAMARVLPEQALVELEAVQLCATLAAEFIAFVSSEGCNGTLEPQDIMRALTALGCVTRRTFSPPAAQADSQHSSLPLMHRFDGYQRLLQKFYAASQAGITERLLKAATQPAAEAEQSEQSSLQAAQPADAEQSAQQPPGI
jgi:hypothetical protein